MSNVLIKFLRRISTTYSICNYYFSNIVVINEEDNELTSFSDLREFYTFEVTDALELIDRVQTGHRPAFEKCQPVQELIELVSQCWSGDMDTRPTAEMVASKLGELKTFLR